MIKRNLRNSYKFYKSSGNNILTFKEYLNINHLFLKFLIQKVLEGFEVTLPARMGIISIRGRKQQLRLDENGNILGLAPDWVKTKKLRDSNPEAKAERKIVYHTNTHSDGIRYRYNWHKNFISNKSLYSLKMTRANKRAASKLIKEGKEYFLIEPKK